MTTPTPIRKPTSTTGWRCDSCRRLLANTLLAEGSVIEIKCPRCGTVNRLDVKPKAA
jgi:LSD1 subclass zinc finger protein